MWSSLKKLHWPEVTPIHHIIKSNVRRKLNFPLLNEICMNWSENAWLVLRPVWGYPDSTIWIILACRIRNPGKLCLWNPESRALESRIELKYPTKEWNLESKFHWKRLESSTRNPESMEWDPESKTVLYSLTWGDSTGLWTANYYSPLFTFHSSGAVI